MALLGFGTVLTMVLAMFLHKISPFYSVGGWILSSGLFRYLTPTDEQLKMASGDAAAHADSGKSKKLNSNSKRASQSTASVSESGQKEGFAVSHNADFFLYKIPVIEGHLVDQLMYGEFRWLVDCTVSAVVFFVVTEIAKALPMSYFIEGENFFVIWVLLVIGVVFGLLWRIFRIYVRDLKSSEATICITVAAVALPSSIAVQLLSESTLDFRINDAYELLEANFSRLMTLLGWSMSLPSVWTFKLLLVPLLTTSAVLMVFPGLFYGSLQSDCLKEYSSSSWIQLRLHLTFLARLTMLFLWSPDFIKDVLRACTGASLSRELLDVTRRYRWIILALHCTWHMLNLRVYLQGFLERARRRIEDLRKEKGLINSLEIQSKVSSVFHSLSVVSVQLTAPVIMVLLLTLLNISYEPYTTPASAGAPPGSNQVSFYYGRVWVSFLDLLLQCSSLVVWWVSLWSTLSSVLALLYFTSPWTA